MIVLHDIFCFFHSQLFVKWDGFLIGDQVDSDILFPSCGGQGGFHQTSADSLPFIFSVNAQVCDIEPIGKICKSEQNTDKKVFFISGPDNSGTMSARAYSWLFSII